MIKSLLQTIPQTGEIVQISIRPKKHAEVRVISEVEISVEKGLSGDHYHGKNRKRQVTLIQSEHIKTVESILEKDIEPTLLRRNLVIKGINLIALKDRRFQLGNEVILQMTGLCHPCSRMEQNLGPGGYQAMRGHGGITASVIRGGIIRIGDKVKMINN